MLGILTVANDLIKMSIFEISFSEIRCGNFEYSFFESRKFVEIFLVMRPDILHRRVEVERGWDSGDGSDIFCYGKG